MTLVEQTLQDGVLQLTLNDPERRNPISPDMREELIVALEIAASDQAVRVIIFTGAGGAFSSGGDLSAMPPESKDASNQRMHRVQLMIRLIAGMAKPTIAAVEGPAAGVSAGLAAICDFVVMADDAKFLFPFSRLGLVPDGGIMASLGHRIGWSAAKRVLLLGDPIGTDTALAMGLADETTAKGKALDRSLELAGELAKRAPMSLAAIKSAFATGPLELEGVLGAELIGQRELYFSQDFAEGKAAFFERREPKFTGK
jgi:enoyl-CoA hydratase/carnithine racemase